MDATMTQKPASHNPRMEGLDYLVFWAFGDTPQELYEYLAQNKDREKDVTFARDGIEFTLRPFSGGGPGVYRAVYQLEACGIYLGMCSDKNLGDETKPQFKVEIKGATLTRFGEKRCFQIVRKLFRALGFDYQASKVKRVDIRCDFDTFTPEDFFELYRAGQYVTRMAHKCFPVFGIDGKCETFQLGKRGRGGSDIVLRCYDKLAEVQGSVEKTNALEQFVLAGKTVDQFEQLTRVEFEVERVALRDRYDCVSVEDLLGSIRRICSDLVNEYVRFYDRKVDRTNTTRSGELHPIWSQVKERFEQFGSKFDEREVQPRRATRQSCDQAKKAVIGYLAKIAAMLDVTMEMPRDLVVFLLEQFHDERCGMSRFNKKVSEKKAELRAQQLEDAQAVLDSRTTVQLLAFGADHG